jgi:antitoxin component YwqK of YwqJK toxin-antitoxin module
MKEKVNWVEGEAEGFATVWYENGQKSFEGSYKNGKKNGLFKEWNERGELISETKFINGQANK